MSLGALVPISVNEMISSSFETKVTDSPGTYNSLQDIERLYNNSIVFDGLLIPRGWDQESFDALAQSGYSGFNASLPSRSFDSAMKAMTEWTERINQNSDINSA